MLEIHLFGAEEGRCDRVVCMLQVLLFLIGSEEAPAEKTGGESGRAIVIHLKLLDEGLELCRRAMHVAECLTETIWSLHRLALLVKCSISLRSGSISSSASIIIND